METPAGQGEEDQYKGPLVDEKEVRSICSSLGISVLSIVKACHRVTYSLRFGDRVSSSGTKEWILSSIEGQQGFTAQTEDHFLVENFWCDNVAEALAEAPNLEVALQGAAEVYDIIAGNVGSNDDEDGSSDAVSHFCYDDEGAATSCGGDNKATGDWSDSDLPMPLTKRAKLMSNHAMAPTAITRLMRDLKRVQRLDTASLGFSLEPSEQDSIAVWDVRLFGFKDCELEGDLERLKKERGMDGVLLEINFPSDYPYAPPAVRVVRPRFQAQTGYILNGAFCFELLTKQGWSPTNDIEMLLVHIRWLMISGKARIDFQETTPYNKTESQRAFRAAAKLHNWAI